MLPFSNFPQYSKLLVIDLLNLQYMNTQRGQLEKRFSYDFSVTKFSVV